MTDSNFSINEDFNEFGSLVELGYEDLGEVQKGVSYLGDLYPKTRDLELYKIFQGSRCGGLSDTTGVWLMPQPEHVTKIQEHI